MKCHAIYKRDTLEGALRSDPSGVELHSPNKKIVIDTIMLQKKTQNLCPVTGSKTNLLSA